MVDLSLLGAGETEVGVPVRANQRNRVISRAERVIDLSSDDESPFTEHFSGSFFKPRDTDADLNSADGDGDEHSESLSWLEDVLEEVDDEELFDNEDKACTLEEARSYRQLLRTVGPEKFFKDNVENSTVSYEKLLTAFGIRPPLFLDHGPDSREAYYGLLRLAFQRELSKRMKLPQYNSIEDAVQLLKSSKNIIVLTGAGISTSLGIPDFRSKDIGLYSKLAHLGLADAQDVFDIGLFREDPSIFYRVARDLLPSIDRFSPTHAFIQLLQEKGKLLTNYTQNIDNIEEKAGIMPEKLVQCHGSFVTASCIKCKAQVPGEAIYPDIMAGTIPRCKQCIEAIHENQSSTGMKRKRSKSGMEKKRRRRFGGSSGTSSDEDDDVPEAGVMKPDITFFGETLPDTFSDRLNNQDRDLVDLVIVIGTSLKVAPVSEVVPYLPAHIPQMYISRTPVAHVEFDVDMLGDCDVVVAELCRRAGWDLQHEMIPYNQKVDVETHEALHSRHFFKEQKDE